MLASSAEAGDNRGVQPEDHDILQELQSLMAGAKALVQWEEQLSGDGLLSPKPVEHVPLRRSAQPERQETGPLATTSGPIEPQIPESRGPRTDSTGPLLGDSSPAASGRPSPSSTRPSPSPTAAPHASTAESPAESPAANPESLDAAAKLHVLAEHASRCRRCDLHRGRNKSVFARGSSTASIVFVGEGPGADEDRLGEPFVGRAGALLDKMILAMGFQRDEVYICNVVKCRPPQNRTPTEPEATACFPYLERQLRIVQPDVVVALGRCAAERLGLAQPGQSGWRGRWGSYQGFVAIPTYHPAYLLRSPEQKGKVWTDLKAVVKKMGRTLPIRR